MIFYPAVVQRKSPSNQHDMLYRVFLYSPSDDFFSNDYNIDNIDEG